MLRRNRGIVLNGLGAIVSTNDGVVSSSSSSSSSTALATVTVTPSSSPATTLSCATCTATSTSTADTGQIISSSGSLSTGAKVGIAIGAIAGVIILVSLFVLLVRSRRGRRRQNGDLGHAPTRIHNFSDKEPQELGGVAAYGGDTRLGFLGMGHKQPAATSHHNVYEMPN